MSLLSLASGRVLGDPSLPGRAGLLRNSAEMRAARSTAAERCQNERPASAYLPRNTRLALRLIDNLLPKSVLCTEDRLICLASDDRDMS